MSVITYTLSKCSKCMRCVQSCPTKAIRMQNNRIVIDKKNCINCFKCINACHHKGITAKGSTLDDISSYNYTVCLVPSALSCHLESKQKVNELFDALRQLGFDEIVDLSPVEAAVYDKAQKYPKNEMYLSSFCPLVNNLVKIKFPVLADKLLPLNYPSEIMAKMIKDQHPNKQIGVFNLCECAAKLALAKFPYQNLQYEVDHALSIVDIFPRIKTLMSNGNKLIELSKEGLITTSPLTIKKDPKILVADGFDSILNILEMAEFGLLEDFELIRLYPCYGGCLGGHLMWGNAYTATRNIDEIASTNVIANINEQYFIKPVFEDIDIDHRSIQEKLKYFNAVNLQLEKLPGYDCTACGLPTCRFMAEEIVNGHKTLKDCQILKTKEGEI